MQQRIYVVTHKSTGAARLVEAQSPASAIRHVATDLFEVKPASASAVARLMGAGAKLEQTVVEKEEAPEQPALALAA